MNETLESIVQKQKCANPSLSFFSYLPTNTQDTSESLLDAMLIKKRNKTPWEKSILLTSPHIAVGNNHYFFCFNFQFVFNQDQNLTLILTAACNLKLLSKFYFLPLRLKKTASQTWWFSWGKRNFQTPVFRGQLSSEEWKSQQYFARWSSFFYLHHCCSSHFERYSVLLWYEPHSIQCLAFAQHQLGQPWVQEKIFQEQIRHFLQLCVGQYSPEISRKKV